MRIDHAKNNVPRTSQLPTYASHIITCDQARIALATSSTQQVVSPSANNQMDPNETYNYNYLQFV